MSDQKTPDAPRRIDAIDALGFPEDLQGHPLLYWMGEDYVRHVTLELLHRFLKQDPGTLMVSVTCDQRPEFRSTVHERTGSVQSVDFVLKLQVVLRDSHGNGWRLKGDGTFRASGLGETRIPTTAVGFDIQSTESVVIAGASPVLPRSDQLLAAFLKELTKGTGSDPLQKSTADLLTFGKESPPDVPALLRGLAAAMPGLELDAAGRAAVVAGALVERGGDALLAMDAILDRVIDALPLVAQFEQALEQEAGDNDVTPQVQEKVASRLPEAARAVLGFNGLQMAAVAHLSRSPEARSNARQRRNLLELAATCAPTYFIFKILSVLDDEELLVLVPSAEKGFIVTLSGISDNFQLQILLADLLIGSGELSGKRPEPAVVRVADGSGPQETHDVVEAWWDMYNATALRPDLTLPSNIQDVPAEQVVWSEGIPMEIPVITGRRVLLLAPLSYPRNWLSNRMFSALLAKITLKERVPSHRVGPILKQLFDARF